MEKSNFALIAIVTVVAIVALVVLLKANSQTAVSANNENVAGEMARGLGGTSTCNCVLDSEGLCTSCTGTCTGGKTCGTQSSSCGCS